MKLASYFQFIFPRPAARTWATTLAIFVTLSCGLQATAHAEAAPIPSESLTTTTTLPAQAEKSKPPETAPSTATSDVPAAKSADIQSWPSFEKAFEAGVASYQAKKYDEARLAFSQALEKEPLNVQALTNLALVQFQLGQKGWAVALLRKAHNLNPDFSTPKASLDFILPQLDVKEIPHEIQMWETLRSHLIVPFTMTGFLALTALCFFATGWLWLQYFGRRREAIREEKILPPFPTIPAFIALIFVASLTLTIMKGIDQGIPRATVVSEKATVFSAPSDQSVALFDLFGGLEVVLKQSNDSWIQVTYPGAATGWVPKSSVFQTSGRAAW
jgi:hypothetical protein